MQLPESWVEKLFARLAVRYGQSWLRQWEGVDIAAVKADWATELAGFSARPDAILHALGHMPADRPPTVGQFAALCRAAPEVYPPALPAPPADPEAAQRMRAMGATIGTNQHKAWAHALRRREVALERLTPAQRAMWRAALAPEIAAERADA